MAGQQEAPVYHPQDALSRAINTTMVTGGVGLFTSAVQNTLQKQNVGPWGIFTKNARTFPAVLGYGVALATILGVFEYSGGRIGGKEADPSVDEYDRRTALRKNFRSPGEQTIAELGERRGIEAPGFAERRRERIKQNYGIDVPVTQASAAPSPLPNVKSAFVPVPVLRPAQLADTSIFSLLSNHPRPLNLSALLYHMTLYQPRFCVSKKLLDDV
ncbi:NADH-ubiquinone oxidoreductase 213 kDa subunit [Microsporum canis CBS 113480]|uniref:NADH-ubiquinone oxidoreductase 213 kDa subunit n=1 Tax=Arthroderma otae (strain ATCC MYA-4605 / CBS 113480) TaxID=554155 RepID=C5FLC8_ARTOC|nr:NADH-ubiquinone oxidoreductase 213 kDa subunit [Microsporum canis CBS 113480]EEQ30500.1 NADH-ubiquinone oxidoreductase 213 kDa subunit [Microsporum canis CBS 113480]